MVAELRTVAEIAAELHLPESTVRYYRDRFAAYVPWVGTGRSRRYPPEAVAVLRCAADLLRSGQPIDTVEAHLAERFPLTATTATQRNGVDRNAATQQQQDNSNATQPSVMAPDMGLALSAVLERQTVLILDRVGAAETALLARLDTLAAELEATRQDLTAAQARIAQLEAPKAPEVSPEPAPAPRPWWAAWRWWR